MLRQGLNNKAGLTGVRVAFDLDMIGIQVIYYGSHQPVATAMHAVMI